MSSELAVLPAIAIAGSPARYDRLNVRTETKKRIRKAAAVRLRE
jgi:hypothetical protein